MARLSSLPASPSSWGSAHNKCIVFVRCRSLGRAKKRASLSQDVISERPLSVYSVEKLHFL